MPTSVRLPPHLEGCRRSMNLPAWLCEKSNAWRDELGIRLGLLADEAKSGPFRAQGRALRSNHVESICLISEMTATMSNNALKLFYKMFISGCEVAPFQ